jgi:DNA repair protein RecO (recombination protein O)
MSHTLHKTDALVLGSTNIGEAHRYIDLLTRDFGRIRGVARSIRFERSKLRFSLQDFSFSSVDLVRGKEVWRIVGAQERANMFTELRGRVLEQEMVARMFALLRRLLPGEEENKELFGIIHYALFFLIDNVSEPEAIRDFECLVVLRILHNLGYLAKDDSSESFLMSTEMTIEDLKKISMIRTAMVKKINRSLHESQL